MSRAFLLEPPYSRASAASGSFLSSLRRLRLEGEEEEEVRERGEEQDAPSEEDMSLFISSLLRRDTGKEEEEVVGEVLG